MKAGGGKRGTECFSIFINNVFWLPSKSLARSQHSLVLTKRRQKKQRNVDIHIKSNFEF